MEGQKNTNAVAGLVLGIISIVLIWIPIINLLSLPLGIIGLILSVKGRKIEAKKGMATAGMVLSIIALVFGVLVSCLCVSCIMYGDKLPYPFGEMWKNKYLK